MLGLLQHALDWSEIWALLIPLVVLFFRRGQPNFFRPVISYLWLALLINAVGIILWQYNIGKSLEEMISNNPLYNLHSVIRFCCFCYFFLLLKQRHFVFLKKVLPLIFVCFLCVNFFFFESFFLRDHLSGNLLSAEAFLLLVYCMLYYISQLREEVERFRSGKAFWVVTGLAIYVVINFFVFLFYVPLITENPDIAERMWNIHNIAYILFCIFMSKAIYVSNPVKG